MRRSIATTGPYSSNEATAAHSQRRHQCGTRPPRTQRDAQSTSQTLCLYPPYPSIHPSIQTTPQNQAIHAHIPPNNTPTIRELPLAPHPHPPHPCPQTLSLSLSLPYQPCQPYPSRSTRSTPCPATSAPATRAPLLLRRSACPRMGHDEHVRQRMVSKFTRVASPFAFTGPKFWAGEDGCVGCVWGLEEEEEEEEEEGRSYLAGR
ncbi:hypothetical protein BKA80DRAFT_66191 [Phyllosticta citrichinensis]